MGVAFFVGRELVRADVENIRKPGMDRQATVRRAEQVIARWIDLHQPTMIAIETPHFAQARHSTTLHRITEALARLGARHSLGVKLSSPTTVRRFVCRKCRPTRLAVARVIATDHVPWLHPFYEKEVKKSWWRKRYWTSMFDAIAVGLATLGNASDQKPSGRAP